MRARPGRLLVVGFAGTAPPEDLFGFASRWGLGGVILFRRNARSADQVRGLVQRLRQGLSRADPGSPCLVFVDQEGGRVERIPEGVPRLPSAREMAREPLERFQVRIEAQARALRALGIDVNLAPVCDVVRPGESGVIGDRSFGEDPARVAERAAAHVRASCRGGILPCAKHFPGHGAAPADSHRTLPEVHLGRSELDRCDLLPFRAAIRAGVPLVMAGHLSFPRVSPGPATLSAHWLQEVLRVQLGFRGAVISDDMEMGALAHAGPPGRTAAAAVIAGCDLLIYGRVLGPGVSLEAIARALAEGVPSARLVQALERGRALGIRAGREAHG